jgi:hypothetical protein
MADDARIRAQSHLPVRVDVVRELRRSLAPRHEGGIRRVVEPPDMTRLVQRVNDLVKGVEVVVVQGQLQLVSIRKDLALVAAEGVRGIADRRAPQAAAAVH